MADGGLSQTDFARVMGVDRSQVSRWAERGLPMLGEHVVAAADGAEWVRANIQGHKVRGSIGARQLSRADRAQTERNLRVAYTLADESNALIAAELLLPHLPEATVRAIVAEQLKRAREGSAECLNDDVPPPPGFASWLDTPEFQRPSPDKHDWPELLKQLAAGDLVKVGGDPAPVPASKARKRGKAAHA